MERHIALAGGISVRVGEATLDERALPGRQPRLVLAMLVCERERPVTSEELAENLWPQGRPRTWEPALRGVVGRVRRFITAAGLGPGDILRADAGTYRLRLDDVEVDLERAERDVRAAANALDGGGLAAAAGLAERARVVLGRPLLAGHDGIWLDEKRRQLERWSLQSLEVLGEARLGLGLPARAAAAAEAAIALDPFRESAHRLLIRALAADGNDAAGLQAYDRCRRLLAEELGVDPAPATQDLRTALLRGAAPAAPAALPSRLGDAPALLPPSTPPYLGLQTFHEQHASRFHGRAADVARLLDRLGDGRFLAVVGPSGCGKSSLVRAGLIPALRQGALRGADTWAIRLLRPGPRPVAGLAALLAEVDPDLDQATTVRDLARDDRALGTIVARILDRGVDAERFLLVIDSRRCSRSVPTTRSGGRSWRRSRRRRPTPAPARW